MKLSRVVIKRLHIERYIDGHVVGGVIPAQSGIHEILDS